jgi:hypothetical protein
MYTAILSEKYVRPDWVTYVTLFRGCADIGANKLGDQIIGHTVKVGLILDTPSAEGYWKLERCLTSYKGRIWFLGMP